ncbi:MAG: hypothetical protein M5U01_11395 [Ardenticatenaceae bacterium]|nr:hypothetical protein [Ardenticatenaceae bacterium]
MTLLMLHATLARAVMIYALILGLWGLVRYARGEGFDGSYLGAVVIAEVLILVQAGSGIVLWLQGLSPSRLIHILYGIVTVISFPATFAFTHGEAGRREMLYWGLIGLFVFGLAIRAQMVA